MATRFARAAGSAVKADNRTAVLYTYRRLLRATYTAFKGDTPTLHASRKFARDQFRASKDLQSGSEEAGAAVQHVQGVITILRQNVVQGELQSNGNHKLHIHDHTERGDNASAKKLQGSTKSFKEIKGSVF
ncbi:Mitochondrial zinc maintenance protein 1, mitochondrial [Oleoguttula sp. CCFEE 5521]